MPKIEVLDVDADSSVSFQTVPITPSPFSLANLYAYWSPDNVVTAVVDSVTRATQIAAYQGNQALIQSAAVSSPAIEQVNGKNVLRTSVARVDRLISGPNAPAGTTLKGADFSAGITTIFAVKDFNTTVIDGLMSVFNFRVRSLSAATLQVQKTASGGTGNVQAAADLATMCVLAFTHDRNTNTIKIYRNGVLLNTNVSANWGSYTDSVLVYGSNYNGAGDASNAQLGDLAIFNKPLELADILAVSQAILAKYIP